jgi:hypothetical protein
MNRQDYFVLENLVHRQRTEAMKTQGLELVRLLRVSAITQTGVLSCRKYTYLHSISCLGQECIDLKNLGATSKFWVLKG